MQKGMKRRRMKGGGDGGWGEREEGKTRWAEH